MLTYPEKLYKGGFNFSNTSRNSKLISEDELKKHMTKTGTTIVGVKCKEGVVLAADTRATQDRVADKNCEKVHFMAPNIVACGAGTAADNEYYTAKLNAELKLLRMNHDRESKVSIMVHRAAMHLFRHGGNLGVYLIVAGYDCDGPHLAQVSATGYVNYDNFMSMGSGSVAAYGVLEPGYRDDLTLEEAKNLACEAIKAGIIYDLGSGSNVDYVVLTKGNLDYHRNAELVGKREVAKPTPYTFAKDGIPVLKHERYEVSKSERIEVGKAPAKMEIE